MICDSEMAFLLSIIDVNMKSESQCDSFSAAHIIIGVIISIISIAVGISGLIVALEGKRHGNVYVTCNLHAGFLCQ